MGLEDKPFLFAMLPFQHVDSIFRVGIFFVYLLFHVSHISSRLAALPLHCTSAAVAKQLRRLADAVGCPKSGVYSLRMFTVNS